MKHLNKIIISILSLLPTPVLAEEDPPRLTGGASTLGLGGMLDKILGYLFPFAGLVCVIFIVIGGYMWITSAGDPSKIKQAQGTLTWAIIGLIFVLVCVAIIKTITDYVVS